ncbi:MAG: rod shape-determining protein MreD [bacterium]
MLILFYSFLFTIAIILQLKVVPLFSIRETTPDLGVIVVILVSMRRGKIHGVGCGFVAGLVFDFFGSGFLGVSSLAKSTSAFVAGTWSNEHMQRRLGVAVGQLFVTILVHDVLYFSILTIGTSLGLGHTFFTRVLPQTCYTLVFMAIILLTFPKMVWGRRRD